MGHICSLSFIYFHFVSIKVLQLIYFFQVYTFLNMIFENFSATSKKSSFLFDEFLKMKQEN